MKIKLNKDINTQYIDWTNVKMGDVFRCKTKDDDDEYLGMKVCVEVDEYKEYILDLSDNELFEFRGDWYFVIEILDCTLVENYNGN